VDNEAKYLMILLGATTFRRTTFSRVAFKRINSRTYTVTYQRFTLALTIVMMVIWSIAILESVILLSATVLNVVAPFVGR
jgi:hypothetical protein